MSPTSL